MALLVLSSTFSFAIEKHFCGDFLVDSAVFSELKKCCSKSDKKTKKPCCKDTVDIINGQNDLQEGTILDLNIEKEVSYFLSHHINFEEVILTPRIHISFEYYDPPDLVMDIQLLDEVFLI